MNQRNKFFTTTWTQVIVVIFILAIAAAASVITSTKSKLTSANDKHIGPGMVVQIAHATDNKTVTKEWKSFVNKYHQYSFKYPLTWTVKETTEKYGSNVFIYDEGNIQRISFIGIANTPDCDTSAVFRNRGNLHPSIFTIGSFESGNSDICGKDKYRLTLLDIHDRYVVVYLDFVNSPAEETARMILKSINNLKQISQPL